MPHRTRKLVRAACVLSALVAYPLPLLVGIASQVSHELDHLLGELEGRAPAAAEEVAQAGSAAASGFMHAHGDVPAHEHEGGIGKLLVAAEHTEQRQSDATVVALELVGHVPASGPMVAFTAEASPAVGTSRSAAIDVSLRPPLPPPRPGSLTA